MVSQALSTTMLDPLFSTSDMTALELERSCTQEEVARHKPKQAAQHTCLEQQRDEAHTQSERAGDRSRGHDYAPFCGGDGG